jgi:hypothetical protein
MHMAINLQAYVETISSNMIDIYIYKPQNNTISKCIEFEMIKTK